MATSYHLELRDHDAHLLVQAGADLGGLSSAIGANPVAHTVLTTLDFPTLDRWRLLLNREGRPYRYYECVGDETRELGQSRSPEWV
jgi:hypothetical protein